jgi:hypothetical protein
MALTLKQLVEEVGQCDVTFAGETMQVEYRAGVLTPAMVEDIGAPDTAQALGECLEEIVISWELLDGEGKMIEPTVANLVNLPMKFLNHVLMAILQDSTPKPETDAPSGGTTRRRGRMKSRTSPNGTTDSKS